MSRVIPINETESDAQPICPRYQNWLKRVAELHRSSRRAHNRRPHFSRPRGRGFNQRGYNQDQEDRQICRRAYYATNSKRNTQVIKKKISMSHSSHSLSGQKRPRRANTIFVKIREKSRNFGIRCRTSVALWRKWIVNGLKHKEDNSMFEPNKLKNADIKVVSLLQN